MPPPPAGPSPRASWLGSPRLHLVPEQAACGARNGLRDLLLPASMGRGAQIPSCPEQSPCNGSGGGGQGGRMTLPERGL